MSESTFSLEKNEDLICPEEMLCLSDDESSDLVRFDSFAEACEHFDWNCLVDPPKIVLQNPWQDLADFCVDIHLLKMISFQGIEAEKLSFEQLLWGCQVISYWKGKKLKTLAQKSLWCAAQYWMILKGENCWIQNYSQNLPSRNYL